MNGRDEEKVERCDKREKREEGVRVGKFIEEVMGCCSGGEGRVSQMNEKKFL